MFLLQKILSKIELKQFIVQWQGRKMLCEEKKEVQPKVNSIDIEEENYINKLLNKLSVLRTTKNRKATKRLKVLLAARLAKTSKTLQHYYASTLNKTKNKKSSAENFRQNLDRKSVV